MAGSLYRSTYVSHTMNIIIYLSMYLLGFCPGVAVDEKPLHQFGQP